MKQSVRCWTFEILHGSSCLTFGITEFGDNDVLDNEQLFCENKHIYNYGVQSSLEYAKSRGQTTKYKLGLSIGSIVQMELDLKRKRLIFYVDGQCKGTAFEHTECGEDIHYKLALNFIYKGNRVKLLDYIESTTSMKSEMETKSKMKTKSEVVRSRDI